MATHTIIVYRHDNLGDALGLLLLSRNISLSEYDLTQIKKQYLRIHKSQRTNFPIIKQFIRTIYKQYCPQICPSIYILSITNCLQESVYQLVKCENNIVLALNTCKKKLVILRIDDTLPTVFCKVASTSYVSNTLLTPINYKIDYGYQDLVKYTPNNRIIYIYDIETNFIKKGPNEYLEPAVLTYIKTNYTDIQTLKEYNTKSIEQCFNNTYMLNGKDCVQQFINRVFLDNRSDVNNDIKDIRIQAFAHYARGMEHVFIIAAIIKTDIIHDKFHLTITHTLGNKALTICLGNIRFSDSYNYIPVSLDKASKDMLNLRKSMTMTLRQFRNINWYNATEQHYKYAKTDTILLYFNLCHLFSTLNQIIQLTTNIEEPIDVFANLSISSIARNIMLAITPQILPSNSLNIFFSKYYYGGRCDIFIQDSSRRHTHKPKLLHKIDINSSYPYQMCKDLPAKCLFMKTVTMQGLNNITDSQDYIIFMHGHLKYNMELMEEYERYCPLLPIKTKGKLVFPILANFIEMGIWWEEWVKVKHYAMFKGEIHLFYFAKTTYKAFVEPLYTLRNQSHGALNYTIKILLNSSYGSTGTKNTRSVLTYDTHAIRTEQTYSNTNAIMHQAAYITALARLELWNQIIYILNNKGTIYYCDTDSIIFEGDLTKISCSTYLGSWKHEESSIVWGFYNLKHYNFGDTIKIKGITQQIIQEKGIANEYCIEITKILNNTCIMMAPLIKRIISLPSKRKFSKYNSDPYII